MYVGFVAGALAVFRACSLHCTMFFSTCHRLAAIYFGSALTKLFEHGGCIKAFLATTATHEVIACEMSRNHTSKRLKLTNFMPVDSKSWKMYP